MKEILEFLGASPAFHVATVDENNRPQVRPFSFAMEWQGRLTFVTNTEKRVYRELAANPRVAISSFNAETGEWMRISGKVGFVKSVEAFRKVYEVMPSLKELYGDEYNPTLICFSIEEGEAATYSFASPEPTVVKL